ncbi:DUF2267 domain-containing protein [Polymorphum gilvum]|uniref:DUF2267 domain-containing protein n=1 Tax=Polymorphum gilvum (strain LMG 25793 / CGMCC 1.9160 / SL003B-26A1) TaxID=991905 RepID=F2IYS9_POLGS|nr:DUF2267 domain-containing protein [Polymorphum gilvum]ADZ69526.1 hypothetical protein SL003B_1097 [Polymorphum gilvum SL003B-26A1]
MATTGITALDHSVQVAAEWLNELSDRLDWPRDNRASYLLLRTVLHAVRDWLNPDEAADLAAQLPLLVRGVYYEGWNPSSTPVHPRSKTAFMERIDKAFSKDSLADPEAAVSAVFWLLDRHVSGGEIEQVRHAMRKELRDLWP